MTIDEPRAIKFSAHQISYRGWFHGWIRKKDGTIWALVELEDGRMSVETFPVGITFLNPKPIELDVIRE